MNTYQKKGNSLSRRCLRSILAENRLSIRRVGARVALTLPWMLMAGASPAWASPSVVNDFINQGSNTSDIVRLLVVMTMMTFVPAIIMTASAFPRVLIALSFTRNAMGTQQTPPNQVLIGIALIMTFFIMSPVISTIRDEAYTPYMEGEIETEEALDLAVEPLKEFMFRQAQTEPETINFFLELHGEGMPQSLEETPTVVVMMAFITSELKKAFTMGFLIYIPFIVVDMIVASVLMAMGMMMIPPITISLPFKILLFVLVDGWNLLFETLIRSFV